MPLKSDETRSSKNAASAGEQIFKGIQGHGEECDFHFHLPPFSYRFCNHSSVISHIHLLPPVHVKEYGFTRKNKVVTRGPCLK